MQTERQPCKFNALHGERGLQLELRLAIAAVGPSASQVVEVLGHVPREDDGGSLRVVDAQRAHGRVVVERALLPLVAWAGGRARREGTNIKI